MNAEPPTMTEATPDLAQQIFNPNPSATSGSKPPSSPPDGGNKPEAPAQSDAPPSTQKLEGAPPEAPKKKSALDKLGGVKKPEPPAPPAAPTKGAPPAEEGIKVLRQAKEEWDRVRPEYEKIKGEYEATKQELAKLKALGLNEQEREEYSKIRELHAVEAVRMSDNFKQKIEMPIIARRDKIKQAGVNARLDGKGISTLLDACDIEDEFQRTKAIRAAFGANEELDLEDFQHLSNIAIKAANEIHEHFYPLEDKTLAEARNIELAARQREKQEKEQAAIKEAEDYKKERARIIEILKNDKLKPIFEAEDLAIDGVTLMDALQGAERGSSLEDRTLETLLLSSAPFILEWTNRKIAELEDIKRATAARNGSAPSRADGRTKEAAVEKPQLSIDEVFGKR